MKRALTENLPIKGMALLIAVLLHLFVRGDEEVVVAVFVDVVSTIPPNKVVLEEPVNRVKVTVRGRASVVQGLETQPIAVDLVDVKGGVFEFSRDLMHFPPGVSIVSIQPPSMKVAIDDLDTAQVQLIPRVVGEVADGHRLIAQHLSQQTVTARGARSLVSKMSVVVTDEVDVSGRVSTFRSAVRIPPSAGIEFEPRSVDLEVVIEAVRSSRVIRDVPVSVRNTRYRNQVLPETVDVTIAGPTTELDALDLDGITAVVDASEEDRKPAGRFQKRIDIENLPDDVSVTRVSPATVTLTTVAVEGREPKPATP